MKVTAFSPWLRVGLLALATGCARIAMPPGLPPDAEAPQARLVAPAAGSTGLPSRPTIEIAFSEYMDRASVGRALIFNPRWEGRLESDWSGRTLHLRPDQALPPGRTWTLEIGKSAKDLAGNALAQPLVVPFSTGEGLDTLQLILRTGSSARADRDGLEFWLWPLAERPLRRFGQAPWRCTPDSTGTAVVKGLGAGPWFAMAVRDANGDGWWQVGQEEAALCSRLLLTPDTLGREAALFRSSLLAGPDTLSLESARFDDREHVHLSAWLETPLLSQWPDSLRRGAAADSVRLGLLELTDSQGRQVPLGALVEQERGWMISLAAAADSLPHRLRFRSGADSLDLSPPLQAFSSPLVDMAALGRAWGTGERTITTALAAQCFPRRARQVLGTDTLSVPVRRLSAQQWELRPQREGGALWLERGFLEAGARQWPDSLLRLMMPAEAPGGAVNPLAEGGIQWRAARIPAGGQWRLLVKQDAVERSVPFTREGLVEGLRPGAWSLSIYQDRDGDGRWSPGRLGHRLAEPWLQLPDAVEVLPGWIQSEVPINLPEWLP